jgi:hypothetical protein
MRNLRDDQLMIESIFVNNGLKQGKSALVAWPQGMENV